MRSLICFALMLFPVAAKAQWEMDDWSMVQRGSESEHSSRIGAAGALADALAERISAQEMAGAADDIKAATESLYNEYVDAWYDAYSTFVGFPYGNFDYISQVVTGDNRMTAGDEAIGYGENDSSGSLDHGINRVEAGDSKWGLGQWAESYAIDDWNDSSDEFGDAEGKFTDAYDFYYSAGTSYAALGAEILNHINNLPDPE